MRSRRKVLAGGAAPACTARSPRPDTSQPRPIRHPEDEAAVSGVTASRASCGGSSVAHPVPSRTVSEAVAHSPPIAGMVQITSRTAVNVPSGFAL